MVNNMNVRFVLVTTIVLFGLCVHCPVSSITSITNRSVIDDLIKFIIENSGNASNKTMNLIIEKVMDIVNNNFTDIVIDNSTKFIIGNFTKFTINNSTKIIFDNSPSPKPTGPNVCTFIKNYVSKQLVTKYEIHSFKTPYFCFNNWKFVCYFVTETAVPIQTETLENNFEVINTCCKGYEKTQNGTKCRPVCKDPCVWGTCISPNVCRCDEYYDGPSCRIRIGCPLGKYGFDCTQTCQCQNNAKCNYLNGNCSCQQGYWGKYCENLCPSGYYGHKCQHVCKCQTGAKCNPVNGVCYCLSGYTGINCEVQCPSGYYGYKCQSECKYQNGTKCDIVNGDCTCLTRYEEYDVELNKCDCQTGTLCNSVNETCSCQPGNLGNIGNNCKHTCPQGYYGKNCQNLCKCQNDSKCDPVNGDCDCAPGYTGEYCSSICPSGFYGYKCQNECKCQNGALCDPVIGTCVCKPGLFGNECEQTCPPGMYGLNCNSTCRCQNQSRCRESDGICLCEPGFYGPTCSEDENECLNALQLESSDNEAIWIFDILVILIFLIISTICMAIIMCCYYYCNQRKIQKYNIGHVDNFELRKSTNTESNHNHIEVICTASNCGMNIRNNMLDSRIPMTSYTNETFYNNYARDHSFDDDTGENLYLEIDESTFKRADDLYDHLDFLRPTVSWKPHYQSAMVLQDQGSSSSKKEETT
ncbi:multiple epidermal growth factor-like domains protein 10 isoform X2 [Rhopalosiphum maidis]|uniref:multiple epidermal growth factor-like domains protein 10 isoform X2 n=1 Tax=Rhopalosiphum maidis TaxID=43146 RepID=UPI000EFE743A|nr:multiple epidermal growth factor-like domains protein 10 isoform X2 [Rhopalosiphum maidis]